jgi:hypothetical protein
MGVGELLPEMWEMLNSLGTIIDRCLLDEFLDRLRARAPDAERDPQVPHEAALIVHDRYVLKVC